MATIRNRDRIELSWDGVYFYFEDGNGRTTLFNPTSGSDVTSVNSLTGVVSITESNLDNSDLSTITTDTTALNSVSYYYADTSSNDITITLDATGITTKKIWTIKKTSASNVLYITPAGGATIDDDSDGVTITLNQTWIKIQFDGTNFKIIG